MDRGLVDGERRRRGRWCLLGCLVGDLRGWRRRLEQANQCGRGVGARRRRGTDRHRVVAGFRLMIVGKIEVLGQHRGRGVIKRDDLGDRGPYRIVLYRLIEL